MSESEDVDMTGAALGGPPVGVAPGGQSSDAGQHTEGQTAAPKAPPKALVTKEMLASDAHVPSSADGGDGNAGEAAEVLQRAERGGVGQAAGDCAFQHDCRPPRSGAADHPDKGADV